MRFRFHLAFAFFAATTAGRAGPADSAIVAAMRLSEKPNYTWISTITDDARTYDIKGKTSAEGYTRVEMPLVNSVRRRLGRSATDTQIEVIFRGNVDCVFDTEKGWTRLDELPTAPANGSSMGGRAGRGGSSRIPGNRPPSGRPSRGGSARGQAGGGDPAAYSNLQLAVSHPHEELAIVVSSHASLKVEGEVVTGALTDLGAQLLLVRDGQKDINPRECQGTFKLWLRDGTVVKYQLRLEGTLQVRSSGSEKSIRVQQSSETKIQDIGTTRVDVPDAARAKLGT